ncbi:MAG: hypothetical protein JSV66_08495 [Trueperaceae bacterium]|nr:MAG: hypothetical protein JSV66_08495 [Trueperaceae bacterium]
MTGWEPARLRPRSNLDEPGIFPLEDELAVGFVLPKIDHPVGKVLGYALGREGTEHAAANF